MCVMWLAVLAVMGVIGGNVTECVDCYAERDLGEVVGGGGLVGFHVVAMDVEGKLAFGGVNLSDEVAVFI